MFCKKYTRVSMNQIGHKGILMVAELIRDAITSPINRNNPITLEIKVWTTLRYLATRKMQSCSADELEISQPPVSRIIHKNINAHFRPHIVQQFIKFPLDKRQCQKRKRFHSPNVNNLLPWNHWSCSWANVGI